MSSDTIITVDNLGKRYSLRHQSNKRYTALRDVIAEKARGLFRRDGSNGDAQSEEEFWALRAVSFEVKRGEVVGIIGRNGAGKSTLLKILSRITEPTEGKVRIKGRVASLLEVGTGFHPELTGRENIFLNGAILGMSRVEIKAKFDEIVAFAEVEKFLDTPVKRYSSGMYVRLAFAVAAHLDPEILIVDEVLAVGDAEFQKKCLGKMKDVSTSGRTILYVSHNMSSVVNLCSHGLLLKGGQLIVDTTAEGAVNAYLQHTVEDASEDPHVLFAGKTPASDNCAITRIEMLDKNDRPKPSLRPNDFVKLRIWFHNVSRTPQGSILIQLTSLQGTIILQLESNPQHVSPLALEPGIRFADCSIESLPLLEGQYFLSAGLAIYGVRMLSWLSDVATLVVSEPLPEGETHMSRHRAGVIIVDSRWECQEATAQPDFVSSVR
ncbi:MAG: lipopolysaccharide transport system ATP-binding protein [Acidobacteriaceae bacterium]|nr:lipopolysaccharide transport system ATP-binding protein [Acidobacteriaceae bacterium]